VTEVSRIRIEGALGSSAIISGQSRLLKLYQKDGAHSGRSSILDWNYGFILFMEKYQLPIPLLRPYISSRQFEQYGMPSPRKHFSGTGRTR
jgi:hypothetical protein